MREDSSEGAKKGKGGEGEGEWMVVERGQGVQQFSASYWLGASSSLHSVI